AVGDSPFGAEEQLQEELVSEGLLPRRHGEPVRELLAALVGERVNLPVGLAALLLAAPPGEPLGSQPVQDRVDLPVALVPEVRDRTLDQLLDVVARHGAEAQHPEDREAARTLARCSAHRALRRPIPRLRTLAASSTAPAYISTIARPGSVASRAATEKKNPPEIR